MNLHTSIVYVWHHGGDRAVEDLRWSLRSVDTHWLTGETYQVFIVGDRPPRWGGFFHLPHHHESSKEGVFRPKAVDAVRKMLAIIREPLINERFVYMYDDICLLNGTGLRDFDRRIGQQEMLPDMHRKSTRHMVQLWDTFDALRSAGHTRVWNYETHLPRAFDKRLMMQVIEKYKPEQNLLLLPTLYFNHHFPEQPPDHLLHKLDNVKAAFHGKENNHSFGLSRERDEVAATNYHLRLMHGKQFVNWDDRAHRDVGLSNALYVLFPERSRFEVAGIPQPPNPLSIAR